MVLLRAAELIGREADGEAAVEQAVFGTSDCDEIAKLIVDLAGQALGSPAAEALFYRSSAGCVAGFASASGRAVVLKAHQPRRGLGALEAVAQVQGAVARAGFPCPSPLLRPLRIGPGLGYFTFETYLPDPGLTKVTPGMLAVSARGLARLASRTTEIGSIGPALWTPKSARGSLYPEPHSPLFDFDNSGRGAEWIDQIAVLALEVMGLDDSEPAVIHGDWSAANVRLSELQLLAVYDWDSLIFAPLSRAVGVAAATWSAWGETPEPPAPNAEGVRRYVREFEIAWRPFSQVERRAAYANALYCLAYTARCEHCVDPAGQSHLRARARLRSEGAELLHP